MDSYFSPLNAFTLQKWALPNNAAESSFGKQKLENSILLLHEKDWKSSLQTMKIEDLAKPAKMRSIIKSHN